MFKLAYQRSKLEQVLEKAIGGANEIVKVNQALMTKLPKTGLDFRGRPTEPINLVLLGEAKQIQQAFFAADWQGAVPITAASWARAFWTGLRDKPYPTGPVTPYYIHTSPQDLSYQQQTSTKSFRQRHHVRFWETNLRLASGAKLWLGMASYDKSLKLFNGFKIGYHHIDPDLDAERDLIAKDLLKQDGKELGRYDLGPMKGKNDHGDAYFTDGKAVVIDLTGVQVEA